MWLVSTIILILGEGWVWDSVLNRGILLKISSVGRLILATNDEVKSLREIYGVAFVGTEGIRSLMLSDDVHDGLYLLWVILFNSRGLVLFLNLSLKMQAGLRLTPVHSVMSGCLLMRFVFFPRIVKVALCALLH